MALIIYKKRGCIKTPFFYYSKQLKKQSSYWLILIDELNLKPKKIRILIIVENTTIKIKSMIRKCFFSKHHEEGNNK